MTKPTLFVCTSCRYKSDQPEYNGKRGGYYLSKELLEDPSIAKLVNIRTVSCLSACNRSCSLAISSLGKTTLMFGDLPAFGSKEAISDLLTKYSQSDDGLVPRQDRHPILKKGILARIPPIS
ncbi:MAG: DUF1636 domain-containing protein [Oligoflexales bacterium]|nr:DUF1636 domain-containing protein [Oligoflexales bacterium]